MGTKVTVTKSGVRLGVVSGGRAKAREAEQPVLVESNSNTQTETVAKDHFVERNGVKFAGTHLLIELWDCKNLGDMTITDQCLRDAASEAGATLLHIHLHHFGPNAGL